MNTLTLCHVERSETSGLRIKKEILHFVQNDNEVILLDVLNKKWWIVDNLETIYFLKMFSGRIRVRISFYVELLHLTI